MTWLCWGCGVFSPEAEERVDADMDEVDEDGDIPAEVVLVCPECGAEDGEEA